jgi:hypothetical protein
MAHEMKEEGKLASEKQKNIQAATEFWADMRQTHGFQNQATVLNVQAVSMTEVAAQEPGSSSKQQVEALLESRENPKRRRRSDDAYKNPTNHYLDTTAKPTKSNTEPNWFCKLVFVFPCSFDGLHGYRNQRLRRTCLIRCQ